MATYECEKCGMSVNATCGHCDAPLENDSLELPDGNCLTAVKYRSRNAPMATAR
jgi:hypothetical protein